MRPVLACHRVALALLTLCASCGVAPPSAGDRDAAAAADARPPVGSDGSPPLPPPGADGATDLDALAPPPPDGATPPPMGGPVQGVVFVSRAILPGGSIYWNVPNDMPGVGAHSRFRPATPGKLVFRLADGTLRTLVDGAHPTPASLDLVDVNAPDVSYDGTTIVFAGLPAGTYSSAPAGNPGAWRLYSIRTDGAGLRQLTRSDQHLDLAQFGAAAGGLAAYDDTDPAWLPDGRVVFSSTRWPSYGQYSGARTTNLYVVNADGTALHRITAERNGADRPQVDPRTGQIVYARWWRNHRFPTNDTTTIADPRGGYVQRDGLTTDRTYAGVCGADCMFRNAWHAAVINPDGTGLAMWGGGYRSDADNHVYGGAFTPEGELLANFFPMYNMTEAAGFGGVRRFHRGPGHYAAVLGVTSQTLAYVHASDPTSFGIYTGAYAAEPDALPDGRLVVAWAPDYNQDYGLYLVNADGTGRALLYDNAGTSEVRPRVVRARPLPPVIADTVAPAASALPPPAAGPYDGDGTWTFAALNVYFNAPVDAEVSSAPAVGSASRIRFFIDHQRTSPGSFPNLDWPVSIGEAPVNPDGSVPRQQAPANVPLFEQLRSASNTVPATGGHAVDGAAQVAGMNFGRPGATARCVGCHSGHTMIPVPATDAEAQWTNLAPGAAVTVSSTRDARQNAGLIDRRVMLGQVSEYWTSASGQTAGQWVQLAFPVPVTVRRVRLYNPRPGGDASCSVAVSGATVRLFADAGATTEVARAAAGALAVAGTDVAFADVRARVVRVEIAGATGTFYGMRVASLGEVEVIARGEAR